MTKYEQRLMYSRLFWLFLGVVCWGAAWWLCAALGGIHVTHSLLKDLAFYFVTTIFLTLAFQDLINGFPDSPPGMWFFFPIVSLIATVAFAILL